MILYDGCSYTYGDELENPEEERFSSLIGGEHVNLGECGKSNDGITRTTIAYCEKNKIDTAVIQFTLYSRREVMRHDRNKWDFISCQKENEMSNAFYQYLQNNSDDLANFHKNKFILENYFKSKNIKYYFINLQHKRRQLGWVPSVWYDLMDHTPLAEMRDILGSGRLNPENYVPPNWGHPSKKGHQLIANHIYENIF
jgi:hypothetical protein